MATKRVKRPVAATIATSMGDIADGAMTPITKVEPPAAPAEAKEWAKGICSQIFGLIAEQGNPWTGLAVQITGAAPDMREELVRQIDARLERERAAVALMSDDADTLTNAKKTLSSTTVNASRCRTIAKAWNAGAGLDGLAEHLGVEKTIEQAGFQPVYGYAAAFLKTAGAQGRKPDSLKVAFVKWLETRKGKPMTDDDKVNFGRLVAFADTLQG